MASLSSHKTALTPPWEHQVAAKAPFQLRGFIPAFTSKGFKASSPISTSSGTMGMMSPQECRCALIPWL